MVLIRLCGCAGWSAPLLFAYGINRFSHDVALCDILVKLHSTSRKLISRNLEMGWFTHREGFTLNHGYKKTFFTSIPLINHNWASLWDFGTYHIGNQWRLRRACAVAPEPSLFTHMKYGSRRRVQPKIRHLASLDGCACVFEEWVYGGRKVP